MPDAIGVPKAGTIVAAALETAGAAIQSRMLDFVLGTDGMEIAALLYLASIIGAIIVVAVGGSYKWGRYLLVGPSLFLFLTQIQTESDSTEWAFGGSEYSQAAVTKALVGIDVAEGGGGGARVSLFYNFWNVFMSEVTHRLIDLLNLTQSDSQFNFIQKVERYMEKVNFVSVSDPDLRLLVRLTLVNECSRYLALQRSAYDLNVLEPVRNQYIQELKDTWDKKPIYLSSQITESQFRGMDKWLESKNVDGSYTCPEIWRKIVEILKPQIEETLLKDFKDGNMPEQDDALTQENFLRQYGRSVSRRSGLLGDSKTADNSSAFIDAVDWLVAKALWNEVWQRNPYLEAMKLEGSSGLYQSGLPYVKGNPSGVNERVSQNIRQFEETNKYAERSRFTTAALSMPYFQGVALCMLSALYPFFAMMVVVPGRAASIFLWMGLWAWLKLWDLGFAVVMLIDNMLYAMFPRGQALTQGEMDEPGSAWQRVLEIDPNYSLSTYYTMISTCLFAVPLVTGVFVKMGGGELVNLMNQGWSNYSSRIAGAAASFARSFQAQGYMKNLRMHTAQKVNEQLQETLKNKIIPRQERIADIEREKAILESGKSNMDNDNLNPAIAALDAESSALRVQIGSIISADALTAQRSVEVGEAGYFASESATAARYYQHSLNDSFAHPGESQFKAGLGNQYYNYSKPASSAVDSGVKALFGGGGK